jgi:hypothetical protein
MVKIYLATCATQQVYEALLRQVHAPLRYSLLHVLKVLIFLTSYRARRNGRSFIHWEDRRRAIPMVRVASPQLPIGHTHPPLVA